MMPCNGRVTYCFKAYHFSMCSEVLRVENCIELQKFVSLSVGFNSRIGQKYRKLEGSLIGRNTCVTCHTLIRVNTV